MASPYRLSIAQFIGHFRKRLDNIANVPFELYQKVLYSLALDPLAKAAFPSAGSRANVVLLLRNLTSWAEADLVSLIQLKLALRSEGRVKFRLYRQVAQRLVTQPIRYKSRLPDSPHFNELLPYAATRQEQKLVELCTYAHLFYTYRSNLVHELREPGYGTDWGRGNTEPYYGESSFGERELVFPVAFVSRLANEALNRLQSHLVANKIAPHSKFNFGSQWHWK